MQEEKKTYTCPFLTFYNNNNNTKKNRITTANAIKGSFSVQVPPSSSSSYTPCIKEQQHNGSVRPFVRRRRYIHERASARTSKSRAGFISSYSILYARIVVFKTKPTSERTNERSAPYNRHLTSRSVPIS